MYQSYSVLTRLHIFTCKNKIKINQSIYYPLVIGSVYASHISTPWGVYKQGPVSTHCFSFTDIHALPSQVPIYTPGLREAIEIKHFAQECKHGGPARIRTHDPLIKSPTPNHCGHRAPPPNLVHRITRAWRRRMLNLMTLKLFSRSRRDI